MSKGSEQVEMPSPEDYLPLIKAQSDANRIDQVTPWGGVRYNNNAMSFDDWQSENPYQASTGPNMDDYRDWSKAGGADGNDRSYNTWLNNYATPSTQETNTRSDYDAYVKSQPQTAEAYFSPEIQSLFTKQFSPEAYNEYGDDYMDNATRYLEPVYDRQTENLEQTMANRGQPVGGELYDDSFGNLMDAQNTGWDNAAFNATRASDAARLQDFNRLMAAFGGTQVSVPTVDTMGPANMALNANISNANLANQNTSNIWNTVGGLGAGMAMGGTGLFAS